MSAKPPQGTDASPSSTCPAPTTGTAQGPAKTARYVPYRHPLLNPPHKSRRQAFLLSNPTFPREVDSIAAKMAVRTIAMRTGDASTIERWEASGMLRLPSRATSPPAKKKARPRKGKSTDSRRSPDRAAEEHTKTGGTPLPQMGSRGLGPGPSTPRDAASRAPPSASAGNSRQEASSDVEGNTPRVIRVNDLVLRPEDVALVNGLIRNEDARGTVVDFGQSHALARAVPIAFSQLLYSSAKNGSIQDVIGGFSSRVNETLKDARRAKNHMEATTDRQRKEALLEIELVKIEAELKEEAKARKQVFYDTWRAKLRLNDVEAKARLEMLQQESDDFDVVIEAHFSEGRAALDKERRAADEWTRLSVILHSQVAEAMLETEREWSDGVSRVALEKRNEYTALSQLLRARAKSIEEERSVVRAKQYEARKHISKDQAELRRSIETAFGRVHRELSRREDAERQRRHLEKQQREKVELTMAQLAMLRSVQRGELETSESHDRRSLVTDLYRDVEWLQRTYADSVTSAKAKATLRLALEKKQAEFQREDTELPRVTLKWLPGSLMGATAPSMASLLPETSSIDASSQLSFAATTNTTSFGGGGSLDYPLNHVGFPVTICRNPSLSIRLDPTKELSDAQRQRKTDVMGGTITVRITACHLPRGAPMREKGRVNADQDTDAVSSAERINTNTSDPSASTPDQQGDATMGATAVSSEGGEDARSRDAPANAGTETSAPVQSDREPRLPEHQTVPETVMLSPLVTPRDVPTTSHEPFTDPFPLSDDRSASVRLHENSATMALRNGIVLQAQRRRPPSTERREHHHSEGSDRPANSTSAVTSSGRRVSRAPVSLSPPLDSPTHQHEHIDGDQQRPREHEDAFEGVSIVVEKDAAAGDRTCDAADEPTEKRPPSAANRPPSSGTPHPPAVGRLSRRESRVGGTPEDPLLPLTPQFEGITRTSSTAVSQRKSGINSSDENGIGFEACLIEVSHEGVVLVDKVPTCVVEAQEEDTQAPDGDDSTPHLKLKILPHTTAFAVCAVLSRIAYRSALLSGGYYAEDVTPAGGTATVRLEMQLFLRKSSSQTETVPIMKTCDAPIRLVRPIAAVPDQHEAMTYLEDAPPLTVFPQWCVYFENGRRLAINNSEAQPPPLPPLPPGTTLPTTSVETTDCEPSMMLIPDSESGGGPKRTEDDDAQLVGLRLQIFISLRDPGDLIILDDACDGLLSLSDIRFGPDPWYRAEEGGRRPTPPPTFVAGNGATATTSDTSNMGSRVGSAHASQSASSLFRKPTPPSATLPSTPPDVAQPLSGREPPRSALRPIRDISLRGRVVARAFGHLVPLTLAKQRGGLSECCSTGKGDDRRLVAYGSPNPSYVVTIQLLPDAASAPLPLLLRLFGGLRFACATSNPYDGNRIIDVHVTSARGRHTVLRRTVRVVPVDDITRVDLQVTAPRVMRCPLETPLHLVQFLPPEEPLFLAPETVVDDPDSVFFKGGYLEVELLLGKQNGDVLYLHLDGDELSTDFGGKIVYYKGGADGDFTAVLSQGYMTGTIPGSMLPMNKSVKDRRKSRLKSLSSPSGALKSASSVGASESRRSSTGRRTSSHSRSGSLVAPFQSNVIVTDGSPAGAPPPLLQVDAFGSSNAQPQVSPRASFTSAQANISAPPLDVTWTKLRIEFTCVSIDMLRSLYRRIAFKNMDRSQTGTRHLEFRLIAGDPTVPRFRKFDPFVPVTSRMQVQVCPSLVSVHHHSMVYREGMGAFPMVNFMNLIEEDSLGYRPWTKGYVKLQVVKGFTTDDRVYMRNVETAVSDNSVSLIELTDIPAIIEAHPKPELIAEMEHARAANDAANAGAGDKKAAKKAAAAKRKGGAGDDAAPSTGGIGIESAAMQAMLRNDLARVMSFLTPEERCRIVRSQDLLATDKSCLGRCTNSASQLFLQLREFDDNRRTNARGLLKKPPSSTSGMPALIPKPPAAEVQQGATPPVQDAATTVTNGSGLMVAPRPPSQGGSSRLGAAGGPSSAPAQPFPIRRRDMIGILRQLTYECRSNNPQDLSKILLLTMCDGCSTSVTHAVLELSVQLIDDVTEIHRCNPGIIEYRNGAEGSFLPLFDDTYLEDPDSDAFNQGYVSVALSQGLQDGDELRFLTLDEQRNLRQPDRDKFDRFRSPRAHLPSHVLHFDFDVNSEAKEIAVFLEVDVFEELEVAAQSPSKARSTSPQVPPPSLTGPDGTAVGRARSQSGPPPALTLALPSASVHDGTEGPNPLLDALEGSGWASPFVQREKVKVGTRVEKLVIAKYDLNLLLLKGGGRSARATTDEDQRLVNIVINFLPLSATVPQVTLAMTGALLRTIAFQCNVKPTKTRSGTRVFTAKVNPGAGAEDGRIKVPVQVSPALTFSTYNPDMHATENKHLTFRRRSGPVHPLCRFTMLSDVLFKAGFVAVEIISGFRIGDDVLRFDDIGLARPFQLKGQNKMLFTVKDLYCGSFYTIDETTASKSPTLARSPQSNASLLSAQASGSKPDAPANYWTPCTKGYIIAFDNMSRMSGNLIQMIIRSISFANTAAQQTVSSRMLKVTVCDGSRFLTSCVETPIFLQVDDEMIETNLGATVPVVAMPVECDFVRPLAGISLTPVDFSRAGSHTVLEVECSNARDIVALPSTMIDMGSGGPLATVVIPSTATGGGVAVGTVRHRAAAHTMVEPSPPSTPAEGSISPTAAAAKRRASVSSEQSLDRHGTITRGQWKAMDLGHMGSRRFVVRFAMCNVQQLECLLRSIEVHRCRTAHPGPLPDVLDATTASMDTSAPDEGGDGPPPSKPPVVRTFLRASLISMLQTAPIMRTTVQVDTLNDPMVSFGGGQTMSHQLEVFPTAAVRAVPRFVAFSWRPSAMSSPSLEETGRQPSFVRRLQRAPSIRKGDGGASAAPPQSEAPLDVSSRGPQDEPAPRPPKPPAAKLLNLTVNTRSGIGSRTCDYFFEKDRIATLIDAQCEGVTPVQPAEAEGSAPAGQTAVTATSKRKAAPPGGSVPASTGAMTDSPPSPDDLEARHGFMRRFKSTMSDPASSDASSRFLAFEFNTKRLTTMPISTGSGSGTALVQRLLRSVAMNSMLAVPFVPHRFSLLTELNGSFEAEQFDVMPTPDATRVGGRDRSNTSTKRTQANAAADAKPNDAPTTPAVLPSAHAADPPPGNLESSVTNTAR